MAKTKERDALVDSLKNVKRDKDHKVVVPKHFGAPYLDEVTAVKDEVVRAAVEGREPDLTDVHPSTIAGAKVTGKSSADITEEDLTVKQQKRTAKKTAAKKTAKKA